MTDKKPEGEYVPKKRSWFARIFGDTDSSFVKRTIQGAPFLSENVKEAMARDSSSPREADLPPDADIGSDAPRQLRAEREDAIARERSRREHGD